MKPAPFTYFRPGTVDDALALLSEHGAGAKILAGGQSLVPVMNFRLAAPACLVDLNRVAGLAGIRLDGGRVVIGAMTRQGALLRDATIAAHAPLLREAASHVGHVQTRSRGTVGGSLAHGDPAAELPMVMAALGATFVIRSAAGERRAAAREFFRGALDTDLAPDEILTGIVLPASAPGARTAFREFARRHGDFAIVAAAAEFGDRGLTAGLGGLEAAPRHCGVLVREMADAGNDPEALDRAVARELSGSEPLGDLHAGPEYRRRLAAVALRDCVARVLRP